MEKSNNPSVSRRQFLGTAATLVSGSVLASNSVFGAPAYIKNLFGPNSLINGVQIGVITYSFREMPDQSAEAVLQYVLESGISAIELMGDPAEIYAGKPKSYVDMRSVFPLMRKRNEKQELTAEEKKKLEDAEAQMKSYNAEVAKWRAGASLAKFEELGKTYKKAGVSIYAFKPNAFGRNNSDAEMEFGMRAAKALGANQVTLEHPSNDDHTLKLGTIAQKVGVKVGYHGHEQQTYTLWDTALAQSPANSLNLDFGHFVAAGNPNPLDFIKLKHDRIVSMHIKDRQTPAHGKGNVVWGQGDTPIREALKLIKDNKYNFPATIELEYKVPEGSTPVAEVKKCLEFCKNSLS
ncbi:sugar phosphate isomerase/epimerase [Emticicia sp. C21]|uniref:sugar phosphate isomerase/epimerase family protein n=1 Tax=Emticicia sp. C21 TaxID=2302915 RepID=UPI000E351670|nr:sugar phosphate isomerase/epimerase [Emticicia sp. C21]RFS18453.1 sugar phosphate isomerase/epimerase [Emticicia sp. C21]